MAPPRKSSPFVKYLFIYFLHLHHAVSLPLHAGKLACTVTDGHVQHNITDMESCVGALASSAREELLSRGAAAATHSALVPPPASIEVAKRFGLFGAIGSAAGSCVVHYCFNGRLGW